MCNRRQGVLCFAPLLAALLVSAAGWIAFACSIHAADFYASISGRTNGSGTIHDPVALSTGLLDDTTPAKPGDTLWLRGGVYPGGTAAYLYGNPGQPVTIRQYPGERAVFDGSNSTNPTLSIYGRWNVWRDIEAMNSSTNRALGEGRPLGLAVLSPNTRLINCVVHDGGGIGFWELSSDAEMYGCLVYNVGYDRIDSNKIKGNGHSVYTQNAVGTKWIHDNILCNSFGEGFNIYATAGFLRGFDLQGNIAFNAGASSISDHRFSNILVGSVSNAPSAFNVVSNYTFTSLGRNGDAVDFAYGETNREDLICTDNIFVGGDIACFAGRCQTLDFRRNLVATTPAQTVMKAGPFNLLTTNSFFDNNQYFGASNRSFVAMENEGNPMNFAAWQSFTGRDSNSVASSALPSGTRVIVRPNKYEPRRAHIAIYNWDQLDRVNVDLSSVLASGDSFEIRNAQNYFGPPVLAGTFTGTPVSLATTNLRAAAPVGMRRSNVRPDKTFNSYVLIPPGSVPVINTLPYIAGLLNQSTRIGQATTPIPFTVDDDITPPSNLSITVTSSNPLLLPASNIVLGGSGNDRTLTLTPAPCQLGTAMVTVTVSDGELAASQSFMLKVEDPVFPTEGLVAHWRFDEGSGMIATDAVAGITGTLANGPQWTNGILGSALQFDGFNDYVGIPDTPALRLVNPFTVSLWFRPATTLTGSNGRRDLFNKPSSYWFLLNYFANDGRIAFVLNSGSPSVRTTTTNWPAGQWQYLAGVYDGTSLSIYVNGLQEASTSATAAVSANSQPLRIGGWSGMSTSASFAGAIDQVRLYRTNLNAAAVRMLFEEANPWQPPLVVCLRTDSSAGRPTLVWQSLGGTRYLIQYKNRLNDADWLPHSGPIMATNSLTSVPVTAGSDALFYRVLATP